MAKQTARNAAYEKSAHGRTPLVTQNKHIRLLVTKEIQDCIRHVRLFQDMLFDMIRVSR